MSHTIQLGHLITMAIELSKAKCVIVVIYKNMYGDLEYRYSATNFTPWTKENILERGSKLKSLFIYPDGTVLDNGGNDFSGGEL